MRPQFSKQDYLNFKAKLSKLEKELLHIDANKKKIIEKENYLIKQINKFKRLISLCRSQFQ